jgi:hypothetical protein
MGEQAKPDFSGYATKAGLRCTDGRMITPDAFKHQDGQRVPLVWQHNHSDPENVLGHAYLYHREDGMYTEGFFNDTAKAKNAKVLVEHKDIVALSIFANQLVEKSKSVLHGLIREVSLVLAGANPGALIDNVSVLHGDDIEIMEDEAYIYTGMELEHAASGASNNSGAAADTASSADSGPTIQEVYDSLDEQQKELVHYLVGQAVEEATSGNAGAAHSADDDASDDVSDNASDEGDDDSNANDSTDGASNDVAHDDDIKEGTSMKHNVFEDNEGKDKDGEGALSHSEKVEFFQRAIQLGSLREAFKDHGLKHGITDIDVLFPEAKNVTDTPEFLARRVEWVQKVLDSITKSPFSRIKSLVADITFEEARAKGYIKGSLKKEEWFSVSRRITTPATVYKKQRLDRDDIIDITDFDVVVWLKAEMRLMFDEEIARAALIGDGRVVDDPDKIKDPMGAPEGAGIRSIANDHDMYAPTVTVDDTATNLEVVDAITRGMGLYKGSGGPVLYTTLSFLTTLLLTRDQFDHRMWRNANELATEMGLSDIVVVEVMEDVPDILGIIVNLRDYRFGTDKGGETSFFDFFDIDYNQYKYLYESRLSGALTKIRSAIVVRRAAAGSSLATPVEPTFNGTTVTVPTTTGVVYKNKDTGATLTTGSPVTLAAGDSLTVEAHPASSSYFFTDNVHDEWTFENVS